MIGGDIGDKLRFGKAPVFQHKGGFGIGLAQQARLGLLSADIGQIPGPDDGGKRCIGIGGFVAENENGHGKTYLRMNLGPYSVAAGRCHGAGACEICIAAMRLLRTDLKTLLRERFSVRWSNGETLFDQGTIRNPKLPGELGSACRG